MTTRLDGKGIQPKDLTPSVYEGASIIENLVLASSNRLRTHLGLRDMDLINEPMPRFVTRKNPSLDNYFADLLLRACYSPVDYLPVFEEHVVRGSEKDVPSSFNPRVVGSVLIGFGRRNPDAKTAYDEHGDDGKRLVPSATQLVFDLQLRRFAEYPGVQCLDPLLYEINIVDSMAGTGYEHLNSVVKSLHLAQFRQPGFVAERLEAQWKRAILGAILSALCVAAGSIQRTEGTSADTENAEALEDLKKEWDEYERKSQAMRNEGFLYPVDSQAFSWVQEKILGEKMLKIEKYLSYFSPRRVLKALRQVWHPKIVSFVMGFLFEAMLQAQQSFQELQVREVPDRSLPGRHVFIYYEKQPNDILPNRGLLARTMNQKRGAIVVIHDPARQITSIHRNTRLNEDVWKNFISQLLEVESDRWHVEKHDDGSISDWALNGTEYRFDVPMTNMTEEQLFHMFEKALSQRVKP